MHNIKIEKKSPRKGTKTEMLITLSTFPIKIEKKSPRKGTKTFFTSSVIPLYL